MRFLLFSVLAACFAAAAQPTAISSGNIVGYMAGVKICKGNNTYALPPKPGKSPITAGEFLDDSGGGGGMGLVPGDRVLVADEIGNELWGVISDDEGKLQIVSDDGHDLSGWRLPTLGGEQVLKIKRQKDIATDVVFSGEFDSEEPLQMPVYISDTPLSKIRIGPIKESKRDIVTVTNRVNVPFQTSVPKKFLIILKNSSQRMVMVDPDSRLIVDATTGKPVNVAANDIDRFAEIKDAALPPNEKMTSSEIKDLSRDVAQKDRDYKIKETLREGIIGVAWNEEHPWWSLICWFSIVGALAFANKIWECLFGCIARVCRAIRRIFSGVTQAGNRRSRDKHKSRRKRR